MKTSKTQTIMSKYAKLDITHADLCAVNSRRDPAKKAKMEEYYAAIKEYLHPVDEEDRFAWAQYIAHLQMLSDSPFKLEDGGDTYKTPTWCFKYTSLVDGKPFRVIFYKPKECKWYEQMQREIKTGEEELAHAIDGYLSTFSYDEEGNRTWLLYESAKCMSGDYELHSEDEGGVVFTIGHGIIWNTHPDDIHNYWRNTLL